MVDLEEGQQAKALNAAPMQQCRPFGKSLEAYNVVLSRASSFLYCLRMYGKPPKAFQIISNEVPLHWVDIWGRRHDARGDISDLHPET